MPRFERAGAGWITKDGQKIRLLFDIDVAQGESVLVSKNRQKKGEKSPDYYLSLIVEDDVVNEQVVAQPQQPTQTSCPF